MTTHDMNEDRRWPDRLAAAASAAVVAARVVAAAREERRRVRYGRPLEADAHAGDGKVFEPHRQWSPRQRRAYAAFEVAYTSVDFAAAFSFVVGAILYFYENLHTEGTWMFLAGSILFALKPTIRLAREIVHVSLGRTGEVAKAMKE